MTGWRGASGSSIPLTRHGSGGIFGGQLTGTLTTANAEASGTPNVSNTATLPVRGTPVTPALVPASGIQPGTRFGVPGVINKPGHVYDNGLPGAGGSNVERGFAYGNPAVTTQEANPAGGPGSIPDASGEANFARRQPYPGVRYPGPTGAYRSYVSGDISPGDPVHANVRRFALETVLANPGRTGGFAPGGGSGFKNVQADAAGGVPGAAINDKLWATDRHGIMNTGTERGGGRHSGYTDPPMDGPPRPALRLVQRTINWQQGTDTSRNQDQYPGENRQYNMQPATQVGEANFIGSTPRIPNTMNEKFEPGLQYVGEQGTGWSPIYGGVPGLWQPYGSYAGYTANQTKGIQSPAEQGSAGDGPQKVFSGLPHGLHSQTYPDYSTTLGRYMAIPQMSLPRQDRPSNATGAGQSYNQTVVPQGQTGTVGVQSSGVAAPGAVQSQSWRVAPSKGWRGIRPGGGQT
jgi:hypothetical protein